MRTSIYSASILASLLCVEACSGEHAGLEPQPMARQSLATIAGCTSPAVRVYFADRESAAALYLAFEGEVRESNYRDRYHLMVLTEQQRTQLAAQGFPIEDACLDAPVVRALAVAADTSCYHTIDQIFADADQLVSAYPTLATRVDIGDSWVKANGGAGHDMSVIKLTNSANTRSKPKLFATSSLHGNENIGAELSIRFAKYLLGEYGRSADATWILDHHEVHLLLRANPDPAGRKNGNSTVNAPTLACATDGSCPPSMLCNTSAGLCEWDAYTGEVCANFVGNIGVDLNRNFNYHWNQCNSANEGLVCTTDVMWCGLAYAGTAGGTEPETQAISSYLASLFGSGDRTGVFLDLHSFSELVMWPWGYTMAAPPDESALRTLGSKLAGFNGYLPRPSYALYGTAGTTVDFAYGTFGVPSFTFELSTTHTENCTTLEADTLPKNLNALLYAAKVVRDPYVTPLGPGAGNVNLSQPTVLEQSSVTLHAAIDDRQYGIYGLEAAQNIQAAEYYVDVPPWTSGARAVPMSPEDGAFGCGDDRNCAYYASEATRLAGALKAQAETDGLATDPCRSPSTDWYTQTCEAYGAALEALKEPVQAVVAGGQLSVGRHTLYVRGQDAAGNWGPISATFVTKLIRGDVNADGAVTIVDALMTAQFSTGQIPPIYYAAAADVNCDGAITIVDALIIAQFYVRVITSLPQCGT